ncbi:hypothetical protein BN7_3472 [Wickerhamomyces ciferrii]|uniref:F-box domain-containing protein n=1 Tax=Wickerhamomyces ciferrii (strain ATCC 14091 / BCRC 22168 / CBS 111 / JCM 3599 / NBRC 0793 / NRRL Y-1031 F-60-10) TaxID=1206466 RepID=K0KP04_WICCF|nr:uncharacterized protein BN7_3472 [Wickerhamomyces ciferrii]CCH43917.1 hypothetical protein BN7_3472 [Wickerhamomyces ciferrii]
METDYLQLLKNLPFELFLRVLDNLNPIDLENFIEFIPGLYNQIKDRYKIVHWPPVVINPKHKDVFLSFEDFADNSDEFLQNISQFKGLILLNFKDFGEHQTVKGLLNEFLSLIPYQNIKFKGFKMYLNVDNVLARSYWKRHRSSIRQPFMDDFCSDILRYTPDVFQYCLLPGLKKIGTCSNFWCPKVIDCFNFTQHESSIKKGEKNHTGKFMGGLESLTLRGVLRAEVLESKVPLFPQELKLDLQSTYTPSLTNKCFQNVTELKLYHINDDIFGFVELPDLVHLEIDGKNLFKVSNLKATKLESLEIYSKLEDPSLELYNIETPQLKKLVICCETFHSAQFVTFDKLEEASIYQPLIRHNLPMIINLENKVSSPIKFVNSVKRISVSSIIPIFTNIFYPNLESLTILDGSGFAGNSKDKTQIHYFPSSVHELVFSSSVSFYKLCHSLGRPGIKKIQIIDTYFWHYGNQIPDLSSISSLYPDVEILFLQDCLLKDFKDSKNHNIKELDITLTDVSVDREILFNFEGAVFSKLRKLRIRRQEKPHDWYDSIILKGFKAPNLEELIMEYVYIPHYFSTLKFPKLRKLSMCHVSELEIVDSEVLEEVKIHRYSRYSFNRKLKAGELRNASVEFY